MLTKSSGGDVLGSASDQLYQPDGLVSQAASNGQPVIYVGINYRLGSESLKFKLAMYWQLLTIVIVFGYATNKALVAMKQANAGLRDQRAAFECKYNNYGKVIFANAGGTRRVTRQYRSFWG
jgi:hypothetical protein